MKEEIKGYRLRIGRGGREGRGGDQGREGENEQVIFKIS